MVQATLTNATLISVIADAFTELRNEIIDNEGVIDDAERILFQHIDKAQKRAGQSLAARNAFAATWKKYVTDGEYNYD